MTKRVTIALDAMGADDGVVPIVEGACQVSLEGDPIDVVLVGGRASIQDVLDRTKHDATRLRIVDAPICVTMDDEPKAALDRHPDCSVLTAGRLVAEGEAHALVSAGNTGALILGASRCFERLDGVRRVGLAAVYPTAMAHGPKDDPFGLMLDVGATLHCEAEDLVAFAVMGSSYSRIVSDIERPRVALLSNGSEAHKGTAAIVEANRRLSKMSSVEFVGNCEGIDIPRGSVDVVVCEGFVGNIVLKMLEGVSEVAKDIAKAAYGRRLRYKVALGLMSRGIERIKSLTDWKQYGGAPIVGFDHAVIKAHGRSNARAIRNAIKVAAKTVRRDLSDSIRDGMG